MINKLILKTAVIEHALNVYKTSLIHELKLGKLKELDEKPVHNKKQEYEYKKQVKETEKYYNDWIKRCEKYNNEISKLIDDKSLLNPIIDSSIDLYSAFTDVLIKSIQGSSGTKNFTPCILEESENGTLFLDNKQYKINK